MAEPTKDGTRIIDIIAEGSIECQNCDKPRNVNAAGEVDECSYCGDDEWNLYDAADAIVP